MKSRLNLKAVLLGFLIAALLTMLSPAQAQNPIQYVFTGEIVSVDDSRNLFNDTYKVGAPISGSFTFFDSGYNQYGDDTIMFYEYYGTANPYGAPVLSPEIRVNAGGRIVTERLDNDPVFIQVTNDYPGVGDDYFVAGDLKYPGFFNDQGGDTLYDDLGLELTDPTGTALNSTGLPLTNLDLNAFSVKTGFVEIVNANTFAHLAFMQYNINTLQAVPEPGSVALLLTGATATVLLVLRRRRPVFYSAERGERYPTDGR